MNEKPQFDIKIGNNSFRAWTPFGMVLATICLIALVTGAVLIAQSSSASVAPALELLAGIRR